MYDLLIYPFAEYSFMSKALLSCILISISAPILGIFLTIKKLSLTGDAISHAILPGVAIGYAIAGMSLTAMTIGGFIAGSIVIVLSSFLSRLTNKSDDSSLASFYLISLATGILIITLNGSNIDLLSILFGSLLTTNNESLLIIFIVSITSVITLFVIKRPFIIDCVDPQFLKNNGINGNIFNIIFMILVVFNLIAGFQTIGTLMAVGLFILPSTILRLWINNIIALCFLSPIIVILSCYIGLIISFYLDYPSSPVIIVLLGSFYLLSLIFGLNGGLLWKIIKLKHLES